MFIYLPVSPSPTAPQGEGILEDGCFGKAYVLIPAIVELFEYLLLLVCEVFSKSSWCLAISFVCGELVRCPHAVLFLRAIVLSVASMLFLMFVGEYVTPLFVNPEDTDLLGMKLFSLSYLTGWGDICFSSFFTALERPVRSLLTSFFVTHPCSDMAI